MPTFWLAEVGGNASDVDVDQQLLLESGGRNSLPDVALPAVPLGDTPHPNVPLPEAHPDGSVREEWTSLQVAEEAMVIEFGLGSGSCLVHFLCSNLFILGIDYYMRRKVFRSLRV